MCIKFKIDSAQNSPRMCMCIEFVIQVLKQKNAHVSFPVGMVRPSLAEVLHFPGTLPCLLKKGRKKAERRQQKGQRMDCRESHSGFDSHNREEQSMDQCRSRLKLSENFEHHWSIQITKNVDQSLVHTFSWGNSYGPMVLKVLLKFHPTLALVHGWLFPAQSKIASKS